jgi:RNA polymerase sigma factor (sigma-70 family)
MNDDLTLLREYAQRNSQDAFAALVSRHVNLVYSVALRQVRDAGLAEEITQAAFIILARKAGSLGDKTILSAWLCRTARYLAANSLKLQYRRQRREQQAQSIMNETAPDETWTQIGPLLDAAMERLGKKDHDAVVLRFFENKNFAEVGAALGASEDAAKMRVSRALDKLRKLFAKKGVQSTTAVIAGTMSANSVLAAPEMLAKSTTAAGLAKGAAASASTLTLIKGAMKIMAWTHMKTTVIAGTAALLVVAGTATVAIYNYEASRPIIGIPKGWSVLNGDADQWTWADGKINARSTTGDTILASDKKYRNVSVSVIASTRNRDADIALRMQDSNNGYFVLFVPDGTPWASENGSHISVIKRVDGNEVTLASFKRRRIPQSANITVNASGSSIGVRLDGVPILDVSDATFRSGFVGLRIYGDTTKPCDGSFAGLMVR